MTRSWPCTVGSGDVVVVVVVVGFGGGGSVGDGSGSSAGGSLGFFHIISINCGGGVHVDVGGVVTGSDVVIAGDVVVFV